MTGTGVTQSPDMSVGQKPTRTKVHLYAFDRDRVELMVKWTDGQMKNLSFANLQF